MHRHRQVAVVLRRLGYRSVRSSEGTQVIRSWGAIGIGNAELRQNSAFEAFHFSGFFIGFVIVADEMQKPMDGQMAEVMTERFVFVIGLATQSLIGDRDVARAYAADRRQRGPVGCNAGNDRTLVGLSMPRQLALSVSDAGVVGQHDREFGIAGVFIDHPGGGLDSAMNDSLGIRLRPPAVGDDKNFSCRRSGADHCYVFRRQRVAEAGLFDTHVRHQGFPAAGRCGNPS